MVRIGCTYPYLGGIKKLFSIDPQLKRKDIDVVASVSFEKLCSPYNRSLQFLFLPNNGD